MNEIKLLLKSVMLLFVMYVGTSLVASPIKLLPNTAGISIGKLQKIENRGETAIVSINFLARVAGDAPTGVVDLVVKKTDISDLDLRLTGMTFVAFLSKAQTNEWRLVVGESYDSLIPHSLLPVFDGLPFESWAPDDRFSLRSELARFMVWIISHRPESGKSFGLLLELLSGPPLDNGVVSEQLVSLSNDRNAKSRSMAIAALVHAEDPRGMERLLSAVSAKEAAVLDEEVVARSLRRVDPKRSDLSAALKQLMGSESLRFRREVALLMARMHSRELVPTLASLLNDPDTEIVSYAVGGLAMFANGVPPGKLEPGPEAAPYRTDDTIAHSVMSADAIRKQRDYYVEFWKSWWERYAEEIMRQ